MTRSFLFLQGPLSDFFERLGEALQGRGHHIHRINLNLGDQLFWRLPAANFRGRFEDWRGFVRREMEAHRTTDVILIGDRRPYHIVAAEEARARGAAVYSTEPGYMRPDWLSLEQDGASTLSRLPRDPATIRQLARDLPAPDLEPRFSTPFALLAALDVAYNLAEVFGRPLYPHYRRHGIYHPLAEYAGWGVNLSRRLLRGRANAAAKDRFAAAAGGYFLFPLQLATDYQMRAHSPYADARDAVREVIASFAAHAGDRRLALIIHPLDNGLVGWRRLVIAEARRYGVADRVAVFFGGTPHAMMQGAAGMVTVNSTVGITALRLGVPVKVLGSAIFDMPGLTAQQRLDDFWAAPEAPDPALVDAFVRVVVGTTQVRGGYYEERSQQQTIATMVERLEAGLYKLPPVGAAELARRAPRPVGRTIAIAGAGSGVGLAVARDYAAPGIRLCLIGGASAGLDRAARDCRLRGALVETLTVDDFDDDRLAADVEALDRQGPIDLLLLSDCAERDLGEVALRLCRRMRRRGRGQIALIEAPAAAPAALVAAGRKLRERLRADNIAVSVVAPHALASRVLAAPEPDRLSAAIRRGLARGRRRIAYPAPLAIGLGALALLPSLAAAWLRPVFAAPIEAIEEADEPAVLSGESPGE